MKATITPKVMLPFIVSKAPTIHTATYPKFPMNCIIDGISPDKNWLLRLALYSFLFNSSNFLLASSVPLYTLTTLIPEYTSSIWPFKFPSSTWRSVKYFCDFPNTKNMNINPKRLDNIAVIAKIQLVTNIIIIVPSSKAVALTKVDNDSFIDWAIVSISLVTLESKSPKAWLSKYFKGKRLIFSLISLRSFFENLFVTVDIIYPSI